MNDLSEIAGILTDAADDLKADNDRAEDEDEEGYCSNCSGSGEGMHDGSRCTVCHGSGVSRSDSYADDAAEYFADMKSEDKLMRDWEASK